jgi:zinc transport system ATP-binding protein
VVPLVSCQNTAFAYDGNVVIQNLNFSVEQGDYLCISGENGSGKSTVVKGLLGLIKPALGTVNIRGVKKDEIGYLPQQTGAQKDFPAGVYEVVLSGRLGKRGMRPFYTGEDRRAAVESMEFLGVAGLRNRCYGELSGGQQKRVLLARTLAADPKLIVLDEPAAGLDPLITEDMYRLLERLNGEGRTIIMVSHDLRRALQSAGKIMQLQNGQLFFGPTADYLRSETGRRFLGHFTA